MSDLRTRLAAVGVTQGELAELCGVSRMAVNVWVRGGNIRAKNSSNMKRLLQILELCREGGGLRLADKSKEERFAVLKRVTSTALD